MVDVQDLHTEVNLIKDLMGSLIRILGMISSGIDLTQLMTKSVKAKQNLDADAGLKTDFPS